jgi:hypothetical protein
MTIEVSNEMIGKGMREERRGEERRGEKEINVRKG